MKKFVVDQPLTIHLQHPKGVQEDHPEIGLARPDGRGVASDLNREDLQHASNRPGRMGLHKTGKSSTVIS